MYIGFIKQKQDTENDSFNEYKQKLKYSDIPSITKIQQCETNKYQACLQTEKQNHWPYIHFLLLSSQYPHV